MSLRERGLAAAVILAGAVLWTAPVFSAAPSDADAEAKEQAEIQKRREADIAKRRAETPQGPVTVEYKDGLVTLTADKAWKLKILSEIGKLAGFKVVGGKASLAPVTMKLAKVPLEEAIRQIAAGEPYWLNYETSGGSKYVVKAVLVGPNALRAAMTMARRDKFRAAREQRIRQEQGIQDPAPAKEDFSRLLPTPAREGSK